MPVHLTCTICEKPFSVPPSRLRLGQPKFCGGACFGASLRVPLTTRLWRKVDKTGDCWIWRGWTNEHGYGRINLRRQDGTHGDPYVHRLAWEEAAGRPLTEDEDVCHTCDTTACVRNDEVGAYTINERTFVRYGHLFAATQVDNNADRDSKERVRHGERHASAKLTDDAVIRARTLYATGAISKRKLANLFGVSYRTMADALDGTTWKHVGRLA